MRYLFEKKHGSFWAISMFVAGTCWAQGWYWQTCVAMLLVAVVAALAESYYEETIRG